MVSFMLRPSYTEEKLHRYPPEEMRRDGRQTARSEYGNEVNNPASEAGIKPEAGFEVLTAVFIQSSILWDITPCIWWKSTDVSGDYICSIFMVSVCVVLVYYLAYSSTLKIEATFSPENCWLHRTTRPEEPYALHCIGYYNRTHILTWHLAVPSQMLRPCCQEEDLPPSPFNFRRIWPDLATATISTEFSPFSLQDGCHRDAKLSQLTVKQLPAKVHTWP
jgi:hypothetical protein